MNKTNVPIQQLDKKEFNEAYDAMMISYKDKFDKYPLPTKNDILDSLLMLGEISLDKYHELR